MTIYSDNAGNKFLGDCIYANHDIVYPSTSYLQAHPHASISAELTDLFTQAGLRFRNVLPQADFNAFTTLKTLFAFGANTNDTIDDRYTAFVVNWGATTNLAGYYRYAMFNDSGYTSTTNAYSSTNMVLPIYINDNIFSVSNQNLSEGWGFITTPTVGVTNINWVGCSDGESLGLYLTQRNMASNTVMHRFFYMGAVANVNSNFNYYSATPVSKSIILADKTDGFISPTATTDIDGGHYIGNTTKILLETGDAQYPIACSDGQTPTTQWATDMYVFDNNATLGYPAIGRVRNLLLAQGSYTIGKPVRIQGTVQPDNGFNCWLPVGTFGGKVVLMRCYSSVNI